MRIYTEKKEVISEIKRDIIEMWQTISTYSMQNKVIEWNEDYDTKEITNYSFCLSDFDNIEELMLYPEFEAAEKNRIREYFKTHKEKDYKDYIKKNIWKDIDNIEESWYELLCMWLKLDLGERLVWWINPWEAWKIRPWVWEEYLDKRNQFDYTYSERINLNWSWLMEEMIKHPTSRQYVFNIWDRWDRNWVNGQKRIPCSLNYQVLIRPTWERDKIWVNLIYNMRSCDFLTHFPIDIIQAVWFLKHVTNRLREELWEQYVIWKLYYNCASLHLYKKDLKENVF